MRHLVVAENPDQATALARDFELLCQCRVTGVYKISYGMELGEAFLGVASRVVGSYSLVDEEESENAGADE